MLSLYNELNKIDDELQKQKTAANNYWRTNTDYDFKGKRRASYEANWISRIMHGIKRRARKNKLEFNLTESDIVMPKYCPVLGIELAISNDRPKDNSPSVDRIDNTKGYIKGNIHVISWRANRLKSNATPAELVQLASYFSRLLTND